MRLSFGAVLLIIFSIILSLLLANVAKIISTEAGLYKNVEHIETSDKKSSQNDNKGGYVKTLDDKPKELMWFLQISDIHVSKFKDEGRVKDFREFCTKTVDIIKPPIVLASGDLTDAKSKYIVSSSQYEEEWKTYNDVLESSGVLKKLKWIDIRGNHDNFNVPALFSHKDMYMTYSSAKKPRSYLEQVTVDNITYNFIAVDGCLNPGPKRQFNFVGVLNRNDTNLLHNLAREAHQKGSYTVWFGHFPTSCILTPDDESHGIRQIIGDYAESMVYLCGHFHTFAGTVPRMYTLHHEGFLELELGDWMQNRLYRVVAFDHGLLSFVDVKHGKWPVVLVTNPKNALFNAPVREDIQLQRESTHIRLLIFSTAPIVECRVKIDTNSWRDCQKVTENFYAAPWNPKNYLKGLHEISVYVLDEHGQSRSVTQKFSLDGTRLPFDIMARLVLMGELNTIVKYFFFGAVLLCVIPLVTFKLWHILVKREIVQRPDLRLNWCKKMWLLSTVDRIFYPIVCYVLYLTVGPWAFGEVIDGHFGIVFVWGVLVDGVLLPGTLNYVHGFWQLLLCQFPLINLIAGNVRRRFYVKQTGKMKEISFCQKIKRHLAFSLIMTVELTLSFIFFYEYGAIAFIVAPMRTWALVLNIFLYLYSLNLPQECLTSAASVWSSEVKSTSSQE
ncbi:transmembrane protein 62-like [Culicoides brevitarsis]|uniref:transmembrane protein 62-like n=1 Tax=Culicoides brevitarsis TaxID=469753 RepID=UPI00307BA11F